MSAVLAACTLTARAEPLVKDGDVIAIVGDSITEGRAYSSLVEDYLLMCQPAKVRAIQFGWGGENVVGLNGRMVEFLAMKPTVVTLCYGMNDGRYVPINDDIRAAFRKGLMQAVEAFQKAGVKVVVGSPGCVDSKTFARQSCSAADYNANLAALRDEARAIATASGSGFADVHAAMFDAMAPAKAKYGNGYTIAGNDGIHPNLNGGLAMAYAMLKSLGFDGDIGTIRVDLGRNTVSTTGRHDIRSLKGNAVTLSSRTYPFCFTGDPKSQGATTGMIEFVPFNADLNRLTLIAVGPAAKYKVTWGDGSKTFTAEQLKSGINLAAEFLDNPFVKPFKAVHDKVNDKQYSETLLLKQLLHSLFTSRRFMPDDDKSINNLVAALPDAQAKLVRDIAQTIEPVTHTITLEPTE